MILGRRKLLCASVATAAAVVSPRLGSAGAYPVKPVRIIVPFAAGGPNDVAARLIAQGLSDRLGKQFYVENIGGGGGNVGTGEASRAAADGYTILTVAPSYAANPALFDSVPYDPVKSFDAVTLAATAPTVLTVHPSVPATTVTELIKAIKDTPGKYSYASPGTGTPPHLLGELFRVSLKLDMVHVPFSSGGQAVQSTLAGNTPISFGALPPAVQHVREGALRALAITSATPADALRGARRTREGDQGKGRELVRGVRRGRGDRRDQHLLGRHPSYAACGPGTRVDAAALADRCEAIEGNRHPSAGHH